MIFFNFGDRITNLFGGVSSYWYKSKNFSRSIILEKFIFCRNISIKLRLKIICVSILTHVCLGIISYNVGIFFFQISLKYPRTT